MALKHTLLALTLTLAFRALGAVAGESTTKVAAAWYAGYHSAAFPLSQVNWSNYTHLTYGFAETTENGTLDISGSDPDLLPVFVADAHKNGVKALVSIGGWTGSRAFSYNVGSASNRTTFVKAVTDFAGEYNLDGIDFDWEAPVNQTIGCNVVSPQDSANFLLFLQELRQSSAGSRLLLTAVVFTSPFPGPDGAPLTDVSGFAKVLDWIAIMTYDIWGTWSATVGPNAPLDDTCAAPANQAGSIVSAVTKWTSAGIPKNQIVLAVPAYGHSYKVAKADAFVAGSTTQLASYPLFNKTAHPAGDKWDGTAGVDVCGNATLPGGTMTFNGMMELGYLNTNGKPNKGIFYRYDNCSETPYVYNSTKKIMVSYDNAQSISAKGKYIQDQSLLGFVMWEAGGDYNYELLTAIRAGAGFNSSSDQQVVTPGQTSKSSGSEGRLFNCRSSFYLYGLGFIAPFLLAVFI